MSCLNTQQTNYATAFQNTTIDENIKWLQNRLNFVRKSIIDEQVMIQTKAQYDSLTSTLTLYYKDSTNTVISGVRFFLADLKPENILISEAYTPRTNKKEYVIFIHVTEGQNAIQSIESVDGQQKIETSFIPQGISLPDQINQDKTAVEEIAGRMQQTIALINNNQR